MNGQPHDFIGHGDFDPVCGVLLLLLQGTHQPSHAVAIASTHQASPPAAEASLPPSPAEPASPAPGSASFRQLEARVDTLFSIANSASDVVVANRGDLEETQQ